MRTKFEVPTLYRLHAGIIKRMASDWSKGQEYMYSEFLSEGNTVFMKAVNTWDYSRSSFSTWLTIKLKWNFNRLQKKMDAPPAEEFDGDEEFTYQDGSDPIKVITMRETLDGLSSEAREVAQLIIDGPAEALDLLGSESPRIIRGILKNYLRAQGWKWESIWGVFKEIKCALRTIPIERRVQKDVRLCRHLIPE